MHELNASVRSRPLIEDRSPSNITTVPWPFSLVPRYLHAFSPYALLSARTTMKTLPLSGRVSTDTTGIFFLASVPRVGAIAAGQMDATVSQPADLYAKYALFYIKAAADGKTFKPGKTDHDSIIIKTPQGNLEDQLAAPLVTVDGSYPDSLKADDAKLWGNQIK